MVENSGIEPLTSCVQSRRSPSWANSPSFLLRRPAKLIFASGSYAPCTHLKLQRFIQKLCFFTNHKLRYLQVVNPSNLNKPIELCLNIKLWWISCERIFICTLERRWSNRRFSYGYLVTTSPQSLIPLWTVASLAFRLRVKSTPMVWRAVSTRPGNVFTVAWLIYDY